MYTYMHIYVYVCVCVCVCVCIGTHDLASVETYDAGTDKWVPVPVCTFSKVLSNWLCIANASTYRGFI